MTVRCMGVEIVGAIGRRPGRRERTITGVSTDSRAVQPGEMFFALRGERCDGHDFALDALRKGAAVAVVSRDVDAPPELQDRIVRVSDTLRALGDAARAYRRRWGGMVIAVTGSNGKTTTREMIHHILSEKIRCKRSPKSFNTDVGVPLTLFQVEQEDRAVIVEMGTNAPGEILALCAIAEPNLGVITCIGETHLEGLGSVEGVAGAKAELLAALGQRGTAFLNADGLHFDFLAGRRQGRVISFGIGEGATFRGRDPKPERGGYSFFIPGGARAWLPVPGRHNVRNALAALAVANHLGLDLADAAARLASFRLPEMRYQMEQIRGVTVVFDGYNANPGSMRAALETFRETPVAGRRIAVLGDMLELGPQSESLHRLLGEEVAQSGVQALWAVGRYADAVASSARQRGISGPVSYAADLNVVADEICGFVRPGDAMLVKGSRGMKLERLLEKLRADDSAGKK